MAAGSNPHPGESDRERVDRNLSELLGELRVALPGVQVLFAFLLVVPFNQRFAQLTALQEKVYFATLLCATGAAVLLIAPSAHHRIEFRLKDKEHIVVLANKLAIAGLGLLAVAMTGAIMLITDLLFGTVATAVVTSLVGLAFALLWYALPLQRRMRRDRSSA